PRKGEPIALTSSLEEFRAREEAAVESLKIFSPYPDLKNYEANGQKAIEKLIAEKKYKKVLCDSSLDGIKAATDDFVNQMRMKKDKQELKCMREAAKLADYGVGCIEREILRCGVSEQRMAAELDYILRTKGAQSMSFATIIASGSNSAYSHHDNTDRKLKDGDTVICDFGVYVNGYCSDITRTFVLGPTEKWVEVYCAVLEAQKKAMDKAKKGVEFKEIDAAARDHIRECGYGRNYVHSTGHGLGLDVHETPALSPAGKGKCEEDMTFTIEPGIYIPKKGGIRIEDDILMTDDGAECLTKAKK
ncbi:MAG: M24 family metallopeptidase, partial [Candidatus Thermoplasmatota archaeon]|nr:M24 family metallopeptidase [Candidatus Thermoplasmatota archaeon]